MSDSYIDSFETQVYGPFAAEQIEAMVAPLDEDFKKPLKRIAARISSATADVAAALKASGETAVVTYKQAPDDTIARSRDVLRRVVRYAESRPNGGVIADAILGGEGLSVVTKRRPSKLVGALSQAINAVTKHASALPESAAWIAELTGAKDALAAFDKSVRASRIERRAMTPEVTRARSEWLRVYGSAKLVVEGVLKLHGKTALLPEVFDDLAEVHRVSGVTDDTAPAQPTAPPS